MAGDMLFYILPRLSRVPYKPEPRNVKPVDKEARFRPLNDEEKQLSAKVNHKQKIVEEDDSPGLYKDKDGQKHFDDYV
ncbi:hypothetical protein [Planctobacterium marinum]|uniref:hypothetical protein n=1 Tax=Planctobacterium marinum TaxID=1631968 RepID=UPI001E568E9D|nr:hypothetical protein [Planctobacterium marinum]MCC2605553.1 hypothetical protein [Planctobacterium marinum]